MHSLRAICRVLLPLLAAALPPLAGAKVAKQSNTVPWQSRHFIASNPLDQARRDALVCINFQQLGADAKRHFQVSIADQILSNQHYDCDGDGVVDSLVVMADFAAQEQKPLTVSWLTHGELAQTPPAQGRTYAELALRLNATLDQNGQYQGGTLVPVEKLELPKNHSVGNRLFKYEGLGWESERVAYRWYFDPRSAIDIFGKTREQLTLAQVGLDGGDYHSLSDWGMDILKVGPSLGLGSLGHWSHGGLEGLNRFDQLSAAVHNDLISGVVLDFDGWKTQSGKRDVKLALTIQPGALLTRVSATSNKALDHWATGIVRHGLTAISSNAGASQWQYLATWGKQSLANDALGMAVFYRQQDLAQLAEDDANHLVIFNGGTSLQYYFAAFWRLPGVANQTEFVGALDRIVRELDAPIQVLAQTANRSTP